MLGWVLVGQWLGLADASRGVPAFAGFVREGGGVVLSTVMPGLDRGIHGGVRVVAGMDPAVEPRDDGKGENRAPPLVKGDDFPQTDIRPALTI